MVTHVPTPRCGAQVNLTPLPLNPFGMNMMAFTSPEDLMKNLPKAIGNMSKAIAGGGFPTDSPTFKISIRLTNVFSRECGNCIKEELILVK